MNTERIQKLIDQCYVLVEGDGIDRDTETYDDHVEFDKHKFAELIVRECITTIKQDRFGKAEHLESEYDDGYVDGMGYAERILKEHFGAKE